MKVQERATEWRKRPMEFRTLLAHPAAGEAATVEHAPLSAPTHPAPLILHALKLDLWAESALEIESLVSLSSKSVW